MAEIPDATEIAEIVRRETRTVLSEQLRALGLPALLAELRRLSSGLMSAAEVGERLGCSAEWVHEHHVPRGLPRYVRLHGRCP